MDISGIDFLGIDRVLRRGSGRIIEQSEKALLVRDGISGAYFLACDDIKAGEELLDLCKGADCGLLAVTGAALGKTAFEKLGFTEKLECYQVAYFGEKPEPSSRLDVRTAGESDLPVITEHYSLISPEELREVVLRGALLMGYDGDEFVGFIGEHLEGSMGLLYVLPEHRRRGYASELQTRMIVSAMERGYVPFGQVVKDNTASLSLQKKLGMTVSDTLTVWMWGRGEVPASTA